MRTTVLSACVLSALLFGCASRRVAIEPSGAPVSVDKVVTVRGNWLKDKGDKFDVSLSIRNDSDDDMLIMLHDITGARGDVGGTVRHTFFGAGERAIDFSPGQTKTFTLVCHLGRPVDTGEFRITLGRVFDNPSHDRKTAGAMIARDVVWTAR